MEGFGPVLVPKRGSVAGGVVVSSGVSSRDVRHPSKPDAERTISTVLGLRRTRLALSSAELGMKFLHTCVGM
jgi:hypothetical protein